MLFTFAVFSSLIVSHLQVQTIGLGRYHPYLEQFLQNSVLCSNNRNKKPTLFIQEYFAPTVCKNPRLWEIKQIKETFSVPSGITSKHNTEWKVLHAVKPKGSANTNLLA